MNKLKILTNLELMNSPVGLVRYLESVKDEGVTVRYEISFSFNPFTGGFGKFFYSEYAGAHTLGEFAIGEMKIRSDLWGHFIETFRDSDKRFEIEPAADEVIRKTIEIWNNTYCGSNPIIRRIQQKGLGFEPS